MMKKSLVVVGIVIIAGVSGGYLLSLMHDSPQPSSPSPSPTTSPVPVTARTDSTAPSSAATVRLADSRQPITAARPAHTSRPSPAEPVAVATGTPTQIITEDGQYYPLRRYKTLVLPNDPGVNQWWVTSTDLPTAWAKGYGTYQTTVAVIDTGFALAHEDLTGRWALNTSESGAATIQAASQRNCTDRGLPLNASCNLIDDNFDTVVDNETGTATAENPSRLNCSDRHLALDRSCNLIDDDGNGFIDDERGWDFANYDSSVQAGETSPSGPATMHGTMTSGVLAATGNNGRGIAGVNWNTKVLPVQALNDDGYGDTLTIARSILYAVSRHVDIISISLGADQEDPYLRQYIDYALNQNIMIVAASGNDGCDCIVYPARYPEVLSVGAHNSTGNPSVFSSFGSALDILAPGENMTLPAWSRTRPTNGYVAGASGTSFATPYVAGLLAQLKSLQPTASYGELIAALNETATHTGLTLATPRTDRLGYGTAQAGGATTRVTATATPQLRYQLGPLDGRTLLDSRRVYDCQGASYPSTPLYEVTQGAAVSYTMSELSRYTALQAGATVRSLGYHCVGQPIDTPTQMRTINLPREIRNEYPKL